MRLLWPELLWLEALLPLLILGYLVLLRRRATRVGSRSREFLARNTVRRAPSWRRHVAPALLLGALALLVLAAARPVATLTLPSRQQTIILAMDVSGSMEAPDVAPTRIGASQRAAKAFAARLPLHVRVGVVAYADAAQLVQRPTLQRDDVMAAIDRLQPQQGTAIGSGLLVALSAIFPDQKIDVQDGAARAHKPAQVLPAGRPQAQPPDPDPVPPGSYSSAAIVLLTDGQNTLGAEPVEAAQLAASRGVKVYTVGFGTKEGTAVGFEGFSVIVRLDEDTLKRVAALTHGEYFRADSGSELDRVYEGLQSKLVLEAQDAEVASLFAAVGAVLLMLAAMISASWHEAT